jgi:PAS domain S-box-containing protein
VLAARQTVAVVDPVPGPRGPVEALAPADLGIGRLFELVNDAIVVGEARTGRIVLWNPGAERIFGYTAEHAVGLSMSVLVPESLREAHEAGLRRYARSGTITLTAPGDTVEVPAVTATGGERWIQLSLAPLPMAADGAFVVACIRDITARRAAEDALRNFVSVAAHDLRSPIAALTSGLELFGLLAPELDEQQAQLLGIVNRQAASLSRLVTDLLDLARLDASEVHPKPAELDVADVLELARAFAPDAPIEAALPVGLRVWADPAHVERILGNLLANAVRHGASPITVSGTTEGPLARIVVADAGGGVPADVRANLFERFAHSRAAGGPGLGLAIARGLARTNGGDLTYDGSADGARFALWLPAVS